MAQYEPPTEQLAIFDPSVFTSNDEPLTINTGSKYFLKYPNAQGTENFVDMNVYGNAKVDGAITATNNLLLNPTNNVNVNGNLTMVNASSARRIIQCGDFKLDNNAGASGTALLRIYTSGTDNYYQSLPNSNLSTINFQLNNSSATTITPLQLTPLAANANVALVANQGLTVWNQPSTFNAGLNVYANSVFDGSLNMAVNSTITMNAGSVINMNGQNITNLNNVSSVNNQSLKVEGLGTGTVVLRTGNNDRLTVSSAGVVTIPNQIVTPTVTSASTLSVTASGGSSILNLNGEGGIQISTGTVQRIGIASGGTTTFFNPISMSGGQGISFLSGGGIISQVVTNASDINSLKRTQVTIDNGGAAGAISFETFDANAGANGRGFFFVPNAGSGSFNPAVVSGDSAIIGRNSGANNNCMALSCYSNDRISLRLNARTVGAPQIISSTGANTTTMDKDTTTYIKPINFTGTTPSARQIQNVGTLSFLDVSGGLTNGTSTSTIYMDTSMSVPGMIYDCSLNNGSHNFTCNDNAGNKVTPVFFGSAITSVLNTFSVRSITTPSNRFDIVTDASNNTNIRARSSTASTNAIININCDSVDASSVITNNSVATITPTYFEMKKPIQLTNSQYGIAKTSSQLGYILSGSFAGTNVTSPTGNTNIGNIALPPGIWDIRVNVSFAPITVGSSFTICDLGLSATSATFATTGELVVGNFSNGPFTLAASRYANFNVSATYSNNITTGTTPIYIVFNLTYTGGVTVSIGANYTITRIA